MFFYKCFRTLIRKVFTFKKIIVLVLKPLFYVSWGTFSEKIFVSKISFFCIILSDLERKIFGLSTKLFSGRLSLFHSTFAEEGFREKNLEKKFFHCFQSWSKNWLLKKHQVECKNFYLRVRKFFLSKNIPFKVIWYFFSGISSESFEKNFRRIVKKSFYMSRGTSWWN